jgi:hypothetical protein
MVHAKSLRVIGQSLELAKLSAFELDMDGQNYVVKTDSLTKTGEWILRHALSPNDISDQSARQSSVNRSVRFSPADISRLDDQARKQRRNDSSPDRHAYSRVSQLLRALGDHLDRTEVTAFRISWTSDSVSVDFQSLDGQSDSRTFTAEKLEQLGSHSRFRRSSRTRFDSNSPDSLKQTRQRNR